MAKSKTFILMTILVLIFMFFGNLIAGAQGMKMAFVAALAAGCCIPWDASADVAYVETFDFGGATCGYGKRPQMGKSVDGNPLTVAGKARDVSDAHPRNAESPMETSPSFSVTDRKPAQLLKADGQILCTRGGNLIATRRLHSLKLYSPTASRLPSLIVTDLRFAQPLNAL